MLNILKLTYLLTYLLAYLPYLLTYLLTYLLACLLAYLLTYLFILSVVCTYLQTLSPDMKLLLSQVIRLAKLVLVSAATNAISKQSFSTMWWAKLCLQSTMVRQWLNNIMVLHVHKKRTNKRLQTLRLQTSLLTILKHALHKTRHRTCLALHA